MTSQDMYTTGVALIISGVLGAWLLMILGLVSYDTSARFLRRWALICTFVVSAGFGMIMTNDPKPQAPPSPAWEMPNIQNSECDVLMWTEHNNQWVCLPTEQMGQDSEWGNDVSR